MRGDPAPRREKAEGVAGTLGGSSQDGGFRTTDLDNNGALVINAEGGEGHPFLTAANLGKTLNNQTPLVCTSDGEVADPILSNQRNTWSNEGSNNFRLRNCIAFDETQITHPTNRSQPEEGGPSHAVAAGARPPAVALTSSRGYVRRLTPRECERLQGFPDDYTLIPWRRVSSGYQDKARADTTGEFAEIDGEMWALAPDGHRYKALGNSMAVPVMRWIGQRIQLMEEIT